MSATKTVERTSGLSTRREDIVHVCRLSVDDPTHRCAPGKGCQMFCGALDDGVLVDSVPAGMVGCIVCEAMESALLR